MMDMELPPEVRAMIQKHLGEKALKTQQRGGRGAWIVTDENGGQATYVLEKDLPKIFGGGSQSDFDLLLLSVKNFDPANQVVVLFNGRDDLQFMCTVDIDQ